MTRMLEELLRIVAYGGFGGLFGYALCSWVNDQHRLTSAILNESENDVPTRRRFLSPATLQPALAILVMIALLLTGISWLSAGRENAEQNRRDCQTVAQLGDTLRGRTANYMEQAVAQQRLWRDIRSILAQGDGPVTDAALQSIDDYLAAQKVYLEHLAQNPYPRELQEDC